MTATDLVLPVLDLSQFDAGPDQRSAFLREVRDAARGPGFFYLIGHGIGEDLTGEVLELSRRFFSLPEPDKLAIEMVNSPHFRGYNRAGFEHTRGKPDWREQVDIGPERAGAALRPAAPPWTAPAGSEPMAGGVPGVQADAARLSGRDDGAGHQRAARLRRRARTARRHVFAPIYTPAPEPAHQDHPLPRPRASESDQGVGAHKDSGFVTLLLQEKQRACRSRLTTAAGSTRRRVAGTLRRQHRRDSRNGLERLSSRQRASRGLAAARVGPPVGRASSSGARHDATVPLLSICRPISPPKRAA